MKNLLLIFILFSFAKPALSQEKQLAVLFEFNKYNLQDSSMLQMVQVLAKNTIERVLIEGHCDSIGSKEYNNHLSNQRAQEVKRFLVQNGIAKSFIKTCIGFGKERPIALNDNEEHRQQNRRVLVHFYFSEPNEIKKQVSFKKDSTKTSIPKDAKQLKAGSKFVLENLFFYGGRHIVREESVYVLQDLLNFLQKHTELTIEIQGHVCCTTIEPDGFDWDTGTENLSEMRAITVFNYLTAHGIDRKRLRCKGYGGSKKINLDESTEELKRINRRVEIKIL